MNNLYRDYTYKQELNSADLMMLGIHLEDTENCHNKVVFCNQVFGLFNDVAAKSRKQLEKYIDLNFTVTTDYPYIWTDVNEFAYE